jgi:small subunit ribosomal protein S1
VREKLSTDLEEEFEEALADGSWEELLSGDAAGDQMVLEEESHRNGRVVAVRRDEVFVELGGREQGCIPLRQFDEPPEVGAVLEVVIQRFNPEEGLYDLRLPSATVEVDDWDDIHEGMLVEARVTGKNTGGLECAVGHLRAFIPVSQVALYRVEDLAEFVGEKLTCLVSEANPQRRNLVLSRRAVLEREKEEARQQLLDSLEPGQVHEGVVRKLVDFGAFVDLGGVDGLLHVSQLAWGRVEHPREVIAEGQRLNVKIQKVDRTAGKISLAYRDLLENPWTDVEKKYPPNGVFEGTVSKIMEFGAFVELEPGVEGLVHISELSHKRVWRVGDVVSEGDKVEVLVLSVDPEAQRISLSMKQLTQPEPAKPEGEDEPGPPAETPKKKRKRPSRPLKGGLDRIGGGDQFGLNW